MKTIQLQLIYWHTDRAVCHPSCPGKKDEQVVLSVKSVPSILQCVSVDSRLFRVMALDCTEMTSIKVFVEEVSNVRKS